MFLTAVGQIPCTSYQTNAGKKEKQTQYTVYHHRFNTMICSRISLNEIICSEDEARNAQYSQYDSE
jgi:hypothetical protein